MRSRASTRWRRCCNDCYRWHNSFVIHTRCDTDWYLIFFYLIRQLPQFHFCIVLFWKNLLPLSLFLITTAVYVWLESFKYMHDVAAAAGTPEKGVPSIFVLPKKCCCCRAVVLLRFAILSNHFFKPLYLLRLSLSCYNNW